jgi:hypothetical protein
MYNYTKNLNIKQATFKPTWLYIKQHTITGLKYFGKTTRPDPYKYSGSGKIWKAHLAKHGKSNVETIWCELFTDIHSLVSYALKFSEDNDIVISKQWANLVIEDGLYGGSLGRERPPEVREKISNSSKGNQNRKGLTNSPEHIQKIRESRLGQTHSESTKAKCGAKNIGKVHTAEHNQKIADFQRGRKKPPRTAEHIEKIAQANRGKQKIIVTCPHCGKSGGGGVMKQWHFEKCRSKGNEA